MNGCIYRTKDGECDLYSEGGRYKAFCELEGCEGRKMSNGDRIRAMTDEELAEWLTMIEKRVINNALSKPFVYTDEQLKADWLDWLRREADND